MTFWSLAFALLAVVVVLAGVAWGEAIETKGYPMTWSLRPPDDVQRRITYARRLVLAGAALQVVSSALAVLALRLT